MGVPLTEVITRLTGIAPLKLAESWDNVGLLVEPEMSNKINNVLLTIDLTEDVVDEALAKNAQMIITYHPNIFAPLKRVTLGHWKERIIVKCLQNNIAVFSPHTSWDAISGGVNDWLGSAFSSKESTPITKVDDSDPHVGMGRVLVLEKPVTLKDAIDKVKKHVGLPHLRVGVAKHKGLESLIETVALCAGSGGSVLKGIKADLYLTGEMLHHDVLEVAQSGTHVILCNHSDSERGFLKVVVDRIKSNDLNVVISEVDKDCLTIM
ncbi:NIF3-like protein 1 isoform X2 [Aethina tumida]|nr:NIF3-like protein 1 isoform X2 [Aethina tumida]